MLTFEDVNICRCFTDQVLRDSDNANSNNLEVLMGTEDRAGRKQLIISLRS